MLELVKSNPDFVTQSIADCIIELSKLRDEDAREPKPSIAATPRIVRRYPDVPHKSSVLKRRAGIFEEERPHHTNLRRTDQEREHLRPPNKRPLNHVRIELTFMNVIYGHFSLAKVRPLLHKDSDEIKLKSEENDEFVCDVDKGQGLVICRDSSLSDWFDQNGICAGCYVHLYSTQNESEIEIAYVPQESKIRRCLVADWDEREKRPKLHYEDISVWVECSEHLFRSSINLDDSRNLQYMARLYGSIFDVLYLGMRDLYNQGEEIVHYRDLHNMVIDKRLHPRLGSVFVELSKNKTCFERLGGGFWRFHPDERIENILDDLIYLKEPFEEIATSIPKEEALNEINFITKLCNSFREVLKRIKGYLSKFFIFRLSNIFGKHIS